MRIFLGSSDTLNTLWSFPLVMRVTKVNLSIEKTFLTNFYGVQKCLIFVVYPCVTSLCENHGTCQNTEDNFKCTCTYRTKGKRHL